MPVRPNHLMLLDRGLATFLGTLLLASTWMWWSTIQFGDPFGVKWLPPKTGISEKSQQPDSVQGQPPQGNSASTNPGIPGGTGMPVQSGPSQTVQETPRNFPQSEQPSVSANLPPPVTSSQPRHPSALPSPFQGGSSPIGGSNHQRAGIGETNRDIFHSEGRQISPLPPLPNTGWEFRESWFGLQWRGENPWFRALRSSEGSPKSPTSPDASNPSVGSPNSQFSSLQGGNPPNIVPEETFHEEQLSSPSDGALRLRLPAGRVSQSRPAE